MPPATPAAGKESLLTAADFIKYTTGFATGALVFSAGLLDKAQHISSFAVVLLIGSWAFLSISVLTGVLAFSRIPIQQSEENYDLEDPYFTVPGKIHQLSFMAAMLALGIVLITLLYGNRVEHKDYKVASALQAAGIAKQHIPGGWVLVGLQKIELQPGVGDSDKTLPVWVVGLTVQKVQASGRPGVTAPDGKLVAPASPTRDTLSLFIDATSGGVVSIP